MMLQKSLTLHHRLTIMAARLVLSKPIKQHFLLLLNNKEKLYETVSGRGKVEILQATTNPPMCSGVSNDNIHHFNDGALTILF